MPEPRQAPAAQYGRGLMTSLVNNSSAYGFSVMITASFGVLGRLQGQPAVGEVALFAFGAVAAISVIDALSTNGFRRRPHIHPDNVVLLGTAGNLLSVAVALALVYGVGALLSGPAAWIAAPLLAAGSYVLVEAAELAVAERLEARVFGEQQAEPGE